MSQELLKAWVHNVLQNPIDEHQLAHAQATKELLKENTRLREALELLLSTHFKNAANATGVQEARAALEGK